ncbi:MAG: hypothetical protein GY832_24515 [Chloroflexi bacterium]|nr:hypothetical protein [Chloroflexota bacterium]
MPSWPSRGENTWPSLGENVWPNLGENVWPSLAENVWPSLAENAWPSLAENAWPIIVRKLTSPWHEVHYQVFSRGESDAVQGTAPLFQPSDEEGQGAPPTNRQSPQQGPPINRDNLPACDHRQRTHPASQRPSPKGTSQCTTWVEQGETARERSGAASTAGTIGRSGR